MNKLLISAASIFLSLAFQTAQAEDGIITIPVTGYASPAGGNWGSPADGYYRWNTNNPYPNPYQVIQYKANAYGMCMNDLNVAQRDCTTAANNNLLANQSQCFTIGMQTVGAGLAAGVVMSLSGIGLVPGAMISASAGTSALLFYNYCNSEATNIHSNATAECSFKAAQKKAYCDQWKP